MPNSTQAEVGVHTVAPLLSEQEAADFLGVTRRTLITLRMRPQSTVPYLRVGAQVKYTHETLLAWASHNAELERRQQAVRSSKALRRSRKNFRSTR